MDRVLALDDATAKAELADVLDNFDQRHRNLSAKFEARADEMEISLSDHALYTDTQRWLVGAYFLQEYSFEATALCNPSIAPHPDQSGTPEGCVRIVLSLRAVGEGHVSSITFRSGMISADGHVAIDTPQKRASMPHIDSRTLFRGGEDVRFSFCAEEDISERVIFPFTSTQTNGVEDARFVTMQGDGARTYYATYTAYDGRSIGSELLETQDFLSFRMTPLRGDASHNKGMALFPRKIDGSYAMIARQDNENLYLLYSDDLYEWNGGVPILSPKYPWEFVQMGNCGSPVEIDEGWLLLTHGVGPMRKYSIGAALLDKADPSRVLGRSVAPIIGPTRSEREGYVPNVVYTCGAMRHGDRIIIPFAISDTMTNFTAPTIQQVLDGMRP